VEEIQGEEIQEERDIQKENNVYRYMRIGFIVGKDDELYDSDHLYDITPKKYLQYDMLNSDVAIAMTIRSAYPDVTVDVILPNELSHKRLQKNDVNFILGYDCINQTVNDPYIKKFAGPQGYKNLKSILGVKKNKVFPPMNFLEFIWSKDTYLQTFQRRKVPISPTIIVSKNTNVKQLLTSIKQKKWKDFIIKPVGGTIAIGVERFCQKECLLEPDLIKNYFEEHKKTYKTFLVQELITGFQKYGEIKMFWINGDYSYAVNTIDRGEDNYQVKHVSDKQVLDKCKDIGEKALSILPKIKVNNKVVKPALVRTDFTCCLSNNHHTPRNYFLNEVEHQDAGSYVNFENIKYPYVQVMADTYVKKAQELIGLGYGKN